MFFCARWVLQIQSPSVSPEIGISVLKFVLENIEENARSASAGFFLIKIPFCE